MIFFYVRVNGFIESINVDSPEIFPMRYLWKADNNKVYYDHWNFTQTANDSFHWISNDSQSSQYYNILSSILPGPRNKCRLNSSHSSSDFQIIQTLYKALWYVSRWSNNHRHYFHFRALHFFFNYLLACPVGLGCRIQRLYLYRRVRSPPNECHGCDTK